jgi:hypothetical protein
MNKLKINMIGGGFQHHVIAAIGDIPKYIEWDKTGNSDISIHIDHAIQWPTNKSKKNYAWILEISGIIPEVISWIRNNISYLENNYELIFTHDKRLIGLSDKIKFLPLNSVPWIKDIKIHNKNKLISMIASTKIYCDGHRYRQQIVEKYKNKMDCFGVGRNPINKKEMGLNDYYFSIAMENDNYPDLITEKVLDCFATGTIPIYWGTPTINEYYNEKGIIFLTNEFKIEDLSPELYYSKMEYIKENFELINQLPIPEDYLFEKFLKNI